MNHMEPSLRSTTRFPLHLPRCLQSGCLHAFSRPVSSSVMTIEARTPVQGKRCSKSAKDSVMTKTVMTACSRHLQVLPVCGENARPAQSRQGCDRAWLQMKDEGFPVTRAWLQMKNSCRGTISWMLLPKLCHLCFPGPDYQAGHVGGQ